MYDLWAATIREVTGRPSFDLLVTSEPAYGDMTAERIGARHVLVDPDRSRRADLRDGGPRATRTRNWEYLSPGVRAWYAKRVCLTGAESTGTTTMTARARRALYDTVWVPEYGREYSVPKDARGEAWTTDEFVHIARRQQELEDEARPRGEPDPVLRHRCADDGDLARAVPGLACARRWRRSPARARTT